MSTRPSFTLGIEEEYQTIDPVTRDLRSHIQAQIIEQGKMRLQERVKPEMHGSVVGGVVGDYLCAKYGDLVGNPLTIEITDSRKIMADGRFLI